MMIDIDDPDLAARLLAADPADLDAVRTAAASPAAAQLREAITGTRRATVHRRRVAWAVAAAAAVVAAVGVPLGLTIVHPAGESAYAAPLVRFAENSPRLLLGADGWQVTRVDETDSRTGEMTFTAGAAHLDVFWVPGVGQKDSDKIDMTALEPATVDGQRAWVGTYGDGEFEAIWSVGDQTREARGNFPDRAGFLAVAQTLERVDVDTWLAALPASVVDPGSRAATVEQMLADVPQPRGFDEAALERSGQVVDRYQLGARVTGAVTCAWIHQWTVGDAAARTEASRAMATSRHWAILLEMEPIGDYPEVLWEYADAINGKPTVMTPLATLEASARSGLGC